MASNSSAMLRKIFDEARPLVEQALDLSAQFAAFRELATNNGLDWSQIKALLKAQVQDERAGDGSKRIDRIIEKADFAQAYADMLGLTDRANLNENKNSAPPHDPSTGEIIETDAERNSAAGRADGCNDASVASPPIPSESNEVESDPSKALDGRGADAVASRHPAAEPDGATHRDYSDVAPPISTHDDFPDMPAFLDRRTAA